MGKSFKALFVSPAGAAYGSERSMLALLRARSFEAEVVCLGGGALERELRELGIRVLPLEFGKYSVRQNPCWHVGFYRRFRQILKTSQPDAVVINLDGNTPLVTLAAVRAGLPVVRFCRFEFKPPTRWLDAWCWQQAKAIICPSDVVKQQVLDWAPELKSRVHRLYEASTAKPATAEEVAAFRAKVHRLIGAPASSPAFGARLSEACEEAGGPVQGETLARNNRLIGCMGRLHRSKRIEVAIRALAEVRKQSDDVRLLIIGDHDGSPAGAAYEMELRQLAKKLNVAENVIFAGYLPADQMSAAIAACSVCVLPSESESFGMVLMEAWAQGVPTVASGVGGCAEITRASGGGYLAPVGDAASLATHLNLLLSESAIMHAMGHKGKLWTAEAANPDNYAARFSDVFLSVTMEA